jgi:segregation and condensation protein A
MLPSPPLVELPDDEDPEKILMRKLLEYKEKYYPLFKDASKKMKDYENTDSFYRAPDSSVGKPRFVLADMNMDGLVKALQKMFFKIEQKAKENQVKTIVRDRFTVEERTVELRDIFSRSPRLLFENLIEEDYSKIEIITTFQAILELLKIQFLHVIQESAFSDIILEKTPEEEKDEENRENSEDNEKQEKEQAIND